MMLEGAGPNGGVLAGLKRLIGRIHHPISGWRRGRTHVDVHEYERRVTVMADLPGVDKPDITVTCNGDVVTLRATGDGGQRHKRIPLPDPVDKRSGRATFNNGVLEVRFDRGDRSDRLRTG